MKVVIAPRPLWLWMTSGKVCLRRSGISYHQHHHHHHQQQHHNHHHHVIRDDPKLVAVEIQEREYELEKKKINDEWERDFKLQQLQSQERIELARIAAQEKADVARQQAQDKADKSRDEMLDALLLLI
jgi:hypothetical protein